jgi:hypothetical protein
MSFKFNIDDYDDIKLAIHDNSLAIFVGAGVTKNFKNSKNKKLGDWNSLVKEFINYLNKPHTLSIDSKKYDYLNEVLKNHAPIDVLNLIESRRDFINHNMLKLVGFFKEYYTLSNDNDFSIIAKISQLVDFVVTTNYDLAFEFGSNGKFTNNVAFKGKKYELNI